MKQSDWHLVHWPIRPEDKLPPERKVVLVFVEGSSLPYCAYIRYAAGDKTCPYFVVYRADKGADVWAWCDCLPKGPDHTKAEFYNHNFEGRGFPKRDSDDFHDYFLTQELDMKSGINVDSVVNTLNRNAHLDSKSWVWNDLKGDFSNRDGVVRLDAVTAAMVAKGYVAQEPMAGSGEAGGHPHISTGSGEKTGRDHAVEFSGVAFKSNQSKPPCCGTQPCIFPDPFAKCPEAFGEGAAPQDPLPTSSPGGPAQVGPAILHQRVIENLKRAHSAMTRLNDGFSGSIGRKVRMQLDPLAEDIEHCLNVVQSFRIEELRVSE